MPPNFARQGGYDAKIPRRMLSNSPSPLAVSPSNSEMEDQFVFSPHRTPSHEPSSFFPPMRPRDPSSRITPSAAGSAQHRVESSLQNSCGISPTRLSPTPPTPHSQPIAIELPPSLSRRIAAESVYTPVEPPLSGRGDHQGGFFPFHEDPDKRITRPHPFHTDSPKVQQQHPVPFKGSHFQRDQLRAGSSNPSVVVPGFQDQQPITMSSATTSSRASTPVTAYVPSGHQNSVPMSLGKYYPTNYEAARSGQSSGQRTSSRTSRTTLRPPSSSGLSASNSRSEIPMSHSTRSDVPRSRTDSDAKRRLQQYQRDMVAQATQAARSLAGLKDPASLAAAHGVVVPSFQAGSNKPTSPRLQPLGSPGPVTPMELEGQGDGGYLARGRGVPSPDARRDNGAVARALKAEEKRKKREGRGSPTVQTGGFGF